MYGLVQGEVNAVAPGKRMLSSMCPTIAVDPGARRLRVGHARRLDDPDDELPGPARPPPAARALDAAVAAPRFHQQDLPDAIEIEKGRVRRRMDRGPPRRWATRSRTTRRAIGRVHAVAVGRDGTLTAVADPRGGGGRRRIPLRRERAVTVAGTGADERAGGLSPALPGRRRSCGCSTSVSCPAQEVWLSLGDGAGDRRGDSRHGGARRPGHRRRRGLRRRLLPAQRQRSTPAAERFGDRAASARRDAADRRQPLRGARPAWSGASHAVATGDAGAIEAALIAEADAIAAEDIAACRAHRRATGPSCSGAAGATVLTHCNAGALATAGYGTALGVIRGAVEAASRSASSPTRRARSCRARG